jgi:hypothetical protein
MQVHNDTYQEYLREYLRQESKFAILINTVATYPPAPKHNRDNNQQKQDCSIQFAKQRRQMTKLVFLGAGVQSQRIGVHLWPFIGVQSQRIGVQRIGVQSQRMDIYQTSTTLHR